jgi:hypothetical protein
MKCFPTNIILAFSLGFFAALTIVSGCNKAADRTLTLFQFQSIKTYAGAFQIDTSQLPGDALKKRTETGKPGSAATRLELNQDYPIEVVLRIAKSDEKTQSP